MTSYDRCESFARYVAELSAIAKDAGIDVVGDDVVDALRDFGITRADFKLLDERPATLGAGYEEWHAPLRRVRNDPRYDVFTILVANEQKAG